jgi:hypothetical protein
MENVGFAVKRKVDDQIGKAWMPTIDSLQSASKGASCG